MICSGQLLTNRFYSKASLLPIQCYYEVSKIYYWTRCIKLNMSESLTTWMECSDASRNINFLRSQSMGTKQYSSKFIVQLQQMNKSLSNRNCYAEKCHSVLCCAQTVAAKFPNFILWCILLTPASSRVPLAVGVTNSCRQPILCLLKN